MPTSPRRLRSAAIDLLLASTNGSRPASIDTGAIFIDRATLPASPKGTEAERSKILRGLSGQGGQSNAFAVSKNLRDRFYSPISDSFVGRMGRCTSLCDRACPAVSALSIA